MIEPENTSQEKLFASIAASRKAREDLIKAMKMLMEDLSCLQMTVKYMQFDLEATRRERDFLKEQLKKYEP